MPRWLRLTTGLVGITVVAWGVMAWRETDAAKPRPTLPSYGQVPDFSLVDDVQQPLRLADLSGRVWIADFIFTRCSGQCLMMSAQMRQLAEAFQREASVAFVSVTVDPVWDTSEVLARYARALGASTPQWRFVTGEREAIHRLCRDGFRLAAVEGDGTSADAVTHSQRFVLVDGRGVIRGYYDSGEADAMSHLRRDIRALLRERS